MGKISMRSPALSLAVGLVLLSLLTPVNADVSGCDHLNLRVNSTSHTELTTACNAVADVLTYFRTIGFIVDPEVSITFDDAVLEGPFEASRVHGYFDPAQSEVVVSRSPLFRPWGIEWDPRLAASFLRHELIHMALLAILRDDSMRLRPEWHEFIAYSVQLSLMDSRLRALVLDRYSGVYAFAEFSQVNEFTSRMDPEVFAVAAYKMYLANGAEVLIGKLLRFEIKPPPLTYPFAVLPHEVQAQ